MRTIRRVKKTPEPRVHIAKPNNDDAPAEYTRCGKLLRALVGRSYVYSVEAATCTACIKDDQRVRKLRNNPAAQR